MSDRQNVITMLAERIKRVDNETRADNVYALQAIATAALALETLCQAERAEKKARDDYNQRKFDTIVAESDVDNEPFPG